MTLDDIITYLGDNTDLSDELIATISDEIYNTLDYTPMFNQIDQLVIELTKRSDS